MLKTSVKVEAINDEERPITFVVLEEDLLQLYKSNKTTLIATNGSVKWSIEYKIHVRVIDGTVSALLLMWDRGIPMMMKLRTEAINDAERSITYKALDGDVIKLYKVFQFTITPGNGVAKWTIVYEKAAASVPPPEIYGVFATAITAVVDLHLLTH
ncbi:Polyketide cyclase/dehydrase and lipid transportsuperfamily protein [Abeliophyllum distichum]|uniref:Polyketide cyclase/dehydrase and lipid transportsuperfamily protein n=1 Tax=Abeliophyllum distichum TaxID=126358 RepID=A0ABD1SGA3_9LAMI